MAGGYPTLNTVSVCLGTKLYLMIGPTLHLGVAHLFTSNNEQTANAWNIHNQYSKEGYLQDGGRIQCQHAVNATYTLVEARPSFSVILIYKKKKKHSSPFRQIEFHHLKSNTHDNVCPWARLPAG